MNIVSRETFSSQNGFILACIGSAVSLGNIWLFPVRISRFGATFLIPYIICMIIVSSTGMVGEVAFGRFARGGPFRAYTTVIERRFKNSKYKNLLGMIPNLTALALAMGYFIVFSWVLRYLLSSITGSLLLNKSIQDYTNFFYTRSLYLDYIWLFFTILIVMLILFFGIKDGIERMNRIGVPLFFIIFICLALYVSQLPRAAQGYNYLFSFHVEHLLDPMIWIYALGQSFFSLALTGSGLMIYGSYLRKSVNIPRSIFIIAIFDLVASLLAAFVIIPAMATAGSRLNAGGSSLLFVYIPYIFKNILGGRFLLIAFFGATLIIGITTLINLVEVLIHGVSYHFHFSREWSIWGICTAILILGLIIRNYVLPWINFCGMYLIPLSTGLTGIMFYWVLNKQTCLQAMNWGYPKKLSNFYYYICRYGYCGLIILVFLFNLLFEEIG